MADPAVAISTEQTFAQRHHFWIRRLHSLSGIIPLGAYLVFHLAANASILGGAASFDGGVSLIHKLGVLVYPIELIFIFIPLAFHIGYGLVIARTARMNDDAYPYWRNRRFSWQRITAYIATAFILYHIWHMHWYGAFLGGANFDTHRPAVSAAEAINRHWWIAPWYAIGVVSTVYHFSNGLWTTLITWGVTLSPRSQRGSAIVCGILGVILGIVGLSAVFGFATFRNGTSPAQEDAEQHAMIHVPIQHPPRSFDSIFHPHGGSKGA